MSVGMWRGDKLADTLLLSLVKDFQANRGNSLDNDYTSVENIPKCKDFVSFQ